MLPDTLDQWFVYFGHLHPVMVHLPVGILVLVLIIELAFYKKNNGSSPLQAVPFMLAAGCLTAAFSCIVGWLLSKEGSYDESTLLLHQWTGIAVALLSGLGWWISKNKNTYTKAKRLYRIVLMMLFVVLMTAGHNGGSLTHGNDYLTAELPPPLNSWLGSGESKDTSRFLRKPVTDINEAYVYADLVQNVLGDKCYSCHSSKKVKGGLRVDDEKLLFKGGKHGVVIEPGNIEGSELIKRILLPQDDDKRMPPQKQPPLTQEEIALLKWWIQNGADTRKKVSEFSSSSAVMPMLAFFASSPAEDSAAGISPLSGIFDTELPPADRAAIDTLSSLGIIVSPVAQNKNLLEISCVNFPAFDDDKMQLLVNVSDHIVSLKLDGTQITDAAFNNISRFRNLVRLNIAYTAVSSAAISKLLSLKGLEYINIVGTKVGNKGLLELHALPNLKKIYCWNSMVTNEGLAAFNREQIIAVGEE
ncbi:MAG: hypothetical protein KF862_14125 [Chitinophagaceae bacterium]|nr:hypothetical protein [Chitinophagaceae bacterium]